MPTDSRLLRLHAADNVLTAIAALPAGAELIIAGDAVVLSTPVPLGHKVAAEQIPKGGRVIKYGAPIGSASESIAAGAHVHTHNLQSDYLPTWLREDQAALFAVQH